MPNSLDILKEKTLSNGQAIGLVFAMFAVFEFYYSGNQTTQNFNRFLQEEKVYRQEAREVHSELRGLSYRNAREAETRVNARMDRKVNPIQKDVEKLKAWMNYQKGKDAGKGK